MPRSKVLQSLVDVEKDSIENEGGGEVEKNTKTVLLWRTSKNWVSKFEGEGGKKKKKIKRRKLKFPSIVSIANESVDIESFEKRCC